MAERAWILRFENARDSFPYCVENSVVVLDCAGNIPDLSSFKSEADLASYLDESLTAMPQDERAALRRQLWAFWHKVSHDDYVLVQTDVDGDFVVARPDADPYRFVPDAPPELRHQLVLGTSVPDFISASVPITALAPDLLGAVEPASIGLTALDVDRASDRLQFLGHEQFFDGMEDGGPFEKFSWPSPHSTPAPNKRGVVGVWGTGPPWGRSELLSLSMIEDLSDEIAAIGDQRSSSLFVSQVAKHLEGNNEVTVEEALSAIEVCWLSTSEPEDVIAEAVRTLDPTLMEESEVPSRQAHLPRTFLASVGKDTLVNWDLCKATGLWGVGANSNVAKKRAQEVRAGDQIVVWLGGQGYAAIATVLGAAEQVEHGDLVPWGGEYAATIPIRVDRELESPVFLHFPNGPQETTGIPKIAFQAGFWGLTDEEARTIIDVMDTGGEFPIHLLFKWNQEREVRTIERHKSVADEKGSVWWGKFGVSDRAALSKKNINRYREQLERGQETTVVLYRPGEVWRARLLEITDNPAAIDDDRLPSYYTKDECNLFVRIDDFEELDPSWPLNHVVLASSPDPSKTPGALGNQRTPLMIVISEVTDIVDAPIAVEQLSMDWLVEQTLWSHDELEELIESVKAKGQVVLAGPPGTGKTWVAEHVARFLTQDVPGTSEIVQFHPSYGYEEFIEGLRPTVDDENKVRFEVVPGKVRQIAEGITKPSQNHVLVIDEMNRANLSRVFGELMYLFEYRTKSIGLQYTEAFELPKNLLFIGTMNTADRSIRSLDLALRRRFEIFECQPSVDILTRYYSGSATNQVQGLIDGFAELNDALSSLLGRHMTIGHTFFMQEVMTSDQLSATWNRQIAPLIEEYFFDQPDIASEFTLARFWPNA